MLPIVFLFQLVLEATQLVTPVPKFEPQTIDGNISIGYGLALGDVDGDGKPDILLADKKQFVWYRNGDWKRFVMIENLTEQDNVCIAARDLDGDGKVEVAVGAQWNPAETSDTTKSGSVHYLIRPKDPSQLWEAVRLHHEPTVHRMQWVKSADGNFYLVVVPLHGRGNKNGVGEGVKVIAYRFPKNPRNTWSTGTIINNMHMT
ncbi:MAG: VCBS repeat-containing protein, partial [Segetibacter sp.]|nr:VCBS repeat-containing protein [Segetibacter sp.]